MQKTITEEGDKKPLLIFSLFLILLLLIGIPTIAYAWTYQSDINHLGSDNTLTSDYVTYDGSLQGTATIDADSQAIIYNIDDTGSNEIIVYDDATIYLLDETASIIRQTTLSNNIITSMSIFEFQGDSYIATLTTTEVNLLDDQLTRVYNYSLDSNAIRGVLNCVPEERCYAVYDNATTNSSVITYNTTTKDESLIKLINLSSNKSLAIETVNNDKGYLICDDDEDGNYGICAIDFITRTLDVAFSSDGIIDDIARTDQISPVVTYGFDGGTQEIAVSYIDCTPDANWDTNYNLHAYKSDGTLYNKRTIVLLDDRAGCSDVSQWSYPYINEISPEFFCGIAEGQPASWSDEQRGLFCFNVDTLANYNVTHNPTGTQLQYNLISADVDDTTDFAQWISYTGMYHFNASLIYNMENSFSNGGLLSYGDVNNDGFGDVVGVTATQVRIISNVDEIADAVSITTDPDNNSITRTISDLRDVTGLNLGFTAIWLIIMAFVSYLLWTNGVNGGVEGFGSLALVNCLMVILGYYLGFLGIGILITMLVIAVAVIVFIVSKGMNGGT